MEAEKQLAKEKGAAQEMNKKAIMLEENAVRKAAVVTYRKVADEHLAAR